MVGRHVEDARIQRDAAKASRSSCPLSKAPPSLGSTNFSRSPWFNKGLAYQHQNPLINIEFIEDKKTKKEKKKDRIYNTEASQEDRRLY